MIDFIGPDLPCAATVSEVTEGKLGRAVVTIARPGLGTVREGEKGG